MIIEATLAGNIFLYSRPLNLNFELLGFSLRIPKIFRCPQMSALAHRRSFSAHKMSEVRQHKFKENLFGESTDGGDL